MNLEFNTVVKPEDYLRNTGVDLENELVTLCTNDLGSQQVYQFIYGVEEWCKEYLAPPNYSFNGTFKTALQVEQFKKGVIYQIQYILKNGSISNDAGFNQSSMQVIDPAFFRQVEMSPDAKRCFRTGGLMNIYRRGC